MKGNKSLPSHLILPDTHCHPKYDNQRLRAAGNFIAEKRPSTVVCLGDFADLPSLYLKEKGKLSFEGRRYKDDIDAVKHGTAELFRGFSTIRGYRPRLVMCLGNHEARIKRVCQENPELNGFLTLDDLGYAKAGWEVYPFLRPVNVDSITYCHYYVSGVKGLPISGENIGKTLCNKLHASAVAGHSHVLDHSERAIINGTKIFGLSAGCFVHKDFEDDWNIATRSMWWSGLILIRDIDGKGYYDSIEMITTRKLERDYL